MHTELPIPSTVPVTLRYLAVDRCRNCRCQRHPIIFICGTCAILFCPMLLTLDVAATAAVAGIPFVLPGTCAILAYTI